MDNDRLPVLKKWSQKYRKVPDSRHLISGRIFSGQEVSVKLRFSNELVGAVRDRLGRDILAIPEDDAHFNVQAEVAVSPQFFAWICGFGDRAQILGPKEVTEAMAAHIAAIARLYSPQG